ncbi:dTDP-4-dehydrorhamnose 3,5-epimerase family protein [Pollutimonas sp. H1-120]|uniref:dTDP-4-dehydrorhamnose 3,5-epimerase family protein n=1 Tax=Pollutimonas sp. H1-120 TaxID=3148824 RepID=UPI003B51F6D1
METSRFSFAQTPLKGVWQVNRKPIRDERGFFTRFYCEDEFSAIGLQGVPTQINHSWSDLQGTVRGMHFQYAPNAESKIVTCLHGEVFDVAVDLRAASPTFLNWFGVTLSAESQNSLVIPPGVAHGFQTLTPEAEVFYLVTTQYSPEHEGGLNPFDPMINIAWPVPVSEVSARDRQRPFLEGKFAGVDMAGASL